MPMQLFEHSWQIVTLLRSIKTLAKQTSKGFIIILQIQGNSTVLNSGEKKFLKQ